MRDLISAGIKLAFDVTTGLQNQVILSKAAKTYNTNTGTASSALTLKTVPAIVIPLPQPNSPPHIVQLALTQNLRKFLIQVADLGSAPPEYYDTITDGGVVYTITAPTLDISASMWSILGTAKK